MVEKNMKEITAAKYDRHFAAQIKKDAKQRLKNQWNRKQLYEIASSFLPDDKDIIEIGCGDGFLTNFIGERKYIGIDFCEVLVKHGQKLYPNRTFITADIREPGIKMLFDDRFSYVCLEVLEHINNDLEVVESIPHGADFVFSVPSRDNAYHVRYFESFDEIQNRYGDYLEFIDKGVFKTNFKNCIRISKTKRK